MASTREAHGAALHQVDPHLKSFESFLDEATAPGPNRQLAGVAAVAVDKTGIIYAHTAGTLSVDASSPLASQPFTLDTTMWIASVTKLLTSISALQLVEKDLIGLDDDVGDILPFLKQVQILLGFDDAGVPQYKPKTKPITLRHLLTHSSGIGYAEFYPLLAREDEYRRRVRDVTVQTQAEYLDMSIMFEPDTSWKYGVSTDWVGLVVTKITGLSLAEYMNAHIFGPLGMNSTSFRLTPELASNVSKINSRVDGALASVDMYPGKPVDGSYESGGTGLWSSSGDVVRVLADLLDEDSKLLSGKGRDLLFTPSLTESSKKALNSALWDPGNVDAKLSPIFHGPALPNGTLVDYSLGGLVTEEDIEGRRRKGTLSWVGLGNLYWTVDRKAGRALFWGNQLLPAGDPISGAAFVRFEEAVYAACGK